MHEFGINYHHLSSTVSSKTSTNPSGTSTPYNNKIDLDVHRCFYSDCIPPPDPSTLPPSDSRPDYASFWDETASWADTEDGWGGNYGDDSYGPPLDGDDVIIPSGVYLPCEYYDTNNFTIIVSTNSFLSFQMQI